MNKRQKEIIERCNYKVLADNNILKDNRLLYKDWLITGTKYYDISSNCIGKELIRYQKDSNLKVVFNDNIELFYIESKDIFDDNCQNSYIIGYKKDDNYQEILIDIFRFNNKLMIGKIDLNSRKYKTGKDIDNYPKVTIEQFLDKSVVKGKCGNTIYKEPYYNTDMLFEVIMDYLNSIDIYNKNNEIKNLFSGIAKFIIEDIDSIFENINKVAINQIKSYENELEGLERYYSSRKNIIKQKIRKIKTMIKVV